MAKDKKKSGQLETIDIDELCSHINNGSIFTAKEILNLQFTDITLVKKKKKPIITSFGTIKKLK
jgi:hypothetical protein